MKTSEYLDRVAVDVAYRRQRLEEMRYLKQVIGWLAVLIVPLAALELLDAWSRTGGHASAIAVACMTAGPQLFIYERFRYQVEVLEAFERRLNPAPPTIPIAIRPRA